KLLPGIITLIGSDTGCVKEPLRNASRFASVETTCISAPSSSTSIPVKYGRVSSWETAKIVCRINLRSSLWDSVHEGEPSASLMRGNSSSLRDGTEKRVLPERIITWLFGSSCRLV